jgi:hydroxyacylglutathione hydrolase
MHPDWLVNSWLVIDPETQSAVLIDSGGPADVIRARLEQSGAKLRQVICTHRHPDHICGNDSYRDDFGAEVLGPELEREVIGSLDRGLVGGEQWEVGGIKIQILAVPGHTAGHLAILIEDEEPHLFCGDVLFRGSVGGTVGVGSSGHEDLRHSIMKVLMPLPQQTHVHPGHMQSTTIEREWEHNPMIRFWRGLPPEHAAEPCTVFDRSAVLLVEAKDYDGGTKCLIRRDDGTMDVVPGSKVKLG